MSHIFEVVGLVGVQKIHVENVDTLSSMDVTHGGVFDSQSSVTHPRRTTVRRCVATARPVIVD